MKTLLILTILIPTIASAFDDSPYSKFSTAGNIESSVISWKAVDDVQEACDSMRRRHGKQPYGFKVNACSYWTVTIMNTNVCHIITNKQTTSWTIGHEMRHCFQGEWHE